MATLNQKMQLAREVFGREPQHGEVRTYAQAVAASSGGTVRVNLGGELIDVTTIGAIDEGDEVIIQVQSGHPVAIGARGGGDKMASAISSVEQAIVDMGDVLSYVWLDDYGQLRITPQPRDEDPDTGVMVNARGVNVVGYTYATHTGSDGFSVAMGEQGVIQVFAEAQSPDFQHNRMRSTDVLYLEADPGSSTSATRTRLILADSETASTYYGNDCGRLEVDGVTVLEAGKNGAGYYFGSSRGDSSIYFARGDFNNHISSFFGTCSTAAATQAKEVYCPEFTERDLAAGSRLLVQFSAAQTYNGSPTLTVNGLGPANVVRNGTTAGARYMWQAGEAVEFVYTGAAWLVVDGALATTTYYGATKLSSAINSTSNAVAATAGAVKQTYDLAASMGTWREVSVTDYLPANFDLKECKCYANDGARLIHFSLYAENSSGSNVTVAANTNLMTFTDSTLYPANMTGAPIARLSSGWRYAGGILDFPIRLFQWSTTSKSWGLRSPSWAFNASNIHWEATYPYASLGIA